MVKVIIDGREIQVEPETTILEAAEKLGIQIPTLCHHKALTPYGACRLCTVEVIRRDGRSRLVTSCNYPIREEIEVKTDAERVVKGRKMILELLLARCPNVEVIRNLAAEMGIEKTRFEEKDETCYLCGLCVRVCQELIGANAISFVSRGVDREVSTAFHTFSDDCIACGACAFVCPTGAIKLEEITAKKPMPLTSAFNMELSPRGNVYIPFPQAVPLVPVIDRTNCLHFLTGTCGACEKFCEARAINYEQEDEIVELDVGAIVVATGYDLYPMGELGEYGHGQVPDVIDGLTFERLLSASGPTSGKVLRPSDGKEAKEVVFVQCAGSRDPEMHMPYCSKICCMYTTKQAMLYKHRVHDGQAYIFYIDIRSAGKRYEEFVQRAMEEDRVLYLRGKVSKIFREGDKVVVWGVDTLSDRQVEIAADLVVLATAMVPGEGTRELAEMLGIETDEFGFFTEMDGNMRPVETSCPGIFLAGAGIGPKDIPETVAQASGAAAKVLSLFAQWSGVPEEMAPLVEMERVAERV